MVYHVFPERKDTKRDIPFCRMKSRCQLFHRFAREQGPANHMASRDVGSSLFHCSCQLLGCQLSHPLGILPHGGQLRAEHLTEINAVIPDDADIVRDGQAMSSG